MSTKPKYTPQTVATRHGNTFIVINSNGVGICEATSNTMARRIARALNAMEAKPKEKPFVFDWSGIPKKFKWAAMDAFQSSWFPYVDRPLMNDTLGVWMGVGYGNELDLPPYPGDWRDSLQKRP